MKNASLTPFLLLFLKAGLEQYLQNVITHLPNWPRLAEFLSSDMKNVKDKTATDFVSTRHSGLLLSGVHFI